MDWDTGAGEGGASEDPTLNPAGVAGVGTQAEARGVDEEEEALVVAAEGAAPKPKTGVAGKTAGTVAEGGPGE